MAQENFKIGDTVKLNSGGPIMTVNYVDDVKVTCIWFIGENKTKTFKETFLKETIHKHED